jgi:hypothetical protein
MGSLGLQDNIQLSSTSPSSYNSSLRGEWAAEMPLKDTFLKMVEPRPLSLMNVQVTIPFRCSWFHWEHSWDTTCLLCKLNFPFDGCWILQSWFLPIISSSPVAGHVLVTLLIFHLHCSATWSFQLSSPGVHRWEVYLLIFLQLSAGGPQGSQIRKRASFSRYACDFALLALSPSTTPFQIWLWVAEMVVLFKTKGCV